MFLVFITDLTSVDDCKQYVQQQKFSMLKVMGLTVFIEFISFYMPSLSLIFDEVRL
jgi:hypothetical protein